MSETINGTSGADLLQGTDGNDTINGGQGRDTIRGGSGDDLLVGSTHLVYNPPYSEYNMAWGTLYTSDGDVYEFSEGFGNDTIEEDVEQSQNAIQMPSDGRDIIRFDATIAASDVLLTMVDNTHMRLSLLDRPDTIVFNVRRAADAPFSNGIDFIEFADGTRWDVLLKMQELASQALTGTTGNDTLIGQDGHDTLMGLAGNDSLTGGHGNDLFIGGQGNDLVVARGEPDQPYWMSVGTIRLAQGQDTIAFGTGDGKDTVVADSQDILELGAGLTRSGMTINLLISGAGAYDLIEKRSAVLSWSTGEEITLPDIGSWDGLTVRFADGSTLTGKALADLAVLPPIIGTQGKDDLHGWNSNNDVLRGLAGNDTLTGLAGNDTLEGGSGKDYLRGGDGNDLLIGGTGADTYSFVNAFGDDTIVDNDWMPFTYDKISFATVSPDKLWLTRTGNDLKIQALGEPATSGSVTIQGWYASSANRIETIQASGLQTLSASKVNALVNAMAAFTPPAPGAVSMDPAVAAQLSSVLASSWN
ncbi:MAG TPA: calcium-binding protein [Aquabacterium sp.]|uniref:calcium-binding protein n=1 Tax=Aquabacterium sp. TaxID=1872578 RepID=UPI002E34D2A5|nr:calcium-binding protein [Aquabacterium sp.]HEX5374491.1 calcium-binding protein [Aquabacterium sp.]